MGTAIKPQYKFELLEKNQWGWRNPFCRPQNNPNESLSCPQRHYVRPLTRLCWGNQNQHHRTWKGLVTLCLRRDRSQFGIEGSSGIELITAESYPVSRINFISLFADLNNQTALAVNKILVCELNMGRASA